MRRALVSGPGHLPAHAPHALEEPGGCGNTGLWTAEERGSERAVCGEGSAHHSFRKPSVGMRSLGASSGASSPELQDSITAAAQGWACPDALPTGSWPWGHGPRNSRMAVPPSIAIPMDSWTPFLQLWSHHQQQGQPCAAATDQPGSQGPHGPPRVGVSLCSVSETEVTEGSSAHRGCEY